MPFRSISQLQTCYKRQDPNWDCDYFLKETPSICSLPYKKGAKSLKSRSVRKGEKTKGKVQVGPRGGKFFIIKEKDSKGVICSIKVYLPQK